MDKKNATILLDDLFDKKFNQNKFEEFLSELFNGFEPRDKDIHLRKEYNEYIESVNFLGLHFNQKNRENIAFYVVKLKKQTSRDRARVMQRNLIGRLLDQYKRDSALVAFYNDEQDDWRFSFVKVDYEIDTESFETKKKFSSAKRYSYLIGPQEPNHSCKSRFLEYLINETQTITIEQIHDIFSVEKVTNEFFEKYNILFNKLKKSLDDVVNVDEAVLAEFKDKNIETSDFAKKLLGQIVFIYFLQKKGWLGVNYEKEYGTGSKKFFEETYKYYKENKDKFNNFFDDIVEPLFYDALNVQRDRDYFKLLDCKIPFLNGGLFDTINDYDWIKTSIKLDDNNFEDIIETFNRFNFTVKEDEPLEKEVAVDPEMLGKVFENLLESRDRKAKGAFYTPREIVHYICQKTLINYLKNNSEVPKDIINEFIEKGYKLVDTIIRQQEEMEKGVRKKFVGNTLEILNEHSEILFKLLTDVKVVDPAVGSGAFPVGMMNELVNAKTILLLLKGKQDINNYELKRDIIENSLYGVDIEYFALDVAKLRFWLSLIVDEESVGEIRPLPNLDHKLMCGNSLIEEFEGVELFDKTLLKGVEAQTSLDRFYKESQSVLDDLRRLQKKFFNAENPNNKRKLKKEIDEKEWSLIEHTLKKNEQSINKLEEYKRTNSKPFFLWELYFSEVFQRENPGFDIVIGNPPYGNLLNEKEKTVVKNLYKSTENEIAAVFVEKSIDLLRNSGDLGFIITFAITFRKDLSKTRKVIYDNFPQCYISSFDRDKVRFFERMSQSVSILLCHEKQSNSKCDFFTTKMYRTAPNLNNMDFEVSNNYLLGNKIGVPFDKSHRLPKIGDKIILSIIDKLLKHENTVKDYLDNDSNSEVYIRTSGNYWYNAWDKKPYESTKIKKILLMDGFDNFLISIMNSSIFYLWLRVYADGRDMNIDILKLFPVLKNYTNYSYLLKINSKRIMDHLFKHFDKTNNRFETSNVKPIIDISDILLGKMFKLTNEEIDYILNFESIIRGGKKVTDTFYILFDYLLFLNDTNNKEYLDKIIKIIDISVEEIYSNNLNMYLTIQNNIKPIADMTSEKEKNTTIQEFIDFSRQILY